MTSLKRFLTGIAVAGMFFLSGYATGTHKNDVIYCGFAESDCKPDFQGQGKWVVIPDAEG